VETDGHQPPNRQICAQTMAHLGRAGRNSYSAGVPASAERPRPAALTFRSRPPGPRLAV